jgi:hypothetical protein
VSAALLALASCSSGPPPAPVIGEAFVGPMELKIRADLPMESATVDTVRHGERLRLLKQRRQLFYLVRTPRGKEGWTDGRQLLSPDDMTALQDLRERALKMPSQGVAITYSDLRIHTLPSRGAPSFLLLKENDKVDVLAQLMAPRTSPPRKPLIPKAPPKAKQEAEKKPKKAPKYPLPPMPKAPPPPANWMELSKTAVSDPDDEEPEMTEAEPAPLPPPVPMDSWSLIRVAGGQAGWALTRALMMAVPDDVARYAEGHRIVSYFSVGEVRDGEDNKKYWLWTTSASQQPFDFDSFRVFIWNIRKHRYETSYIERNLKGYSPVLVKEVGYPDPAQRGHTAKFTGFSVCVEKADGKRYRREYAMLGTAVRLAGEGPCEEPRPFDVKSAAPLAPAPGAQPSAAPAGSLSERLKKKVKSWFGK